MPKQVYTGIFRSIQFRISSEHPKHCNCSKFLFYCPPESSISMCLVELGEGWLLLLRKLTRTELVLFSLILYHPIQLVIRSTNFCFFIVFHLQLASINVAIVFCSKSGMSLAYN